MMISTRGRYALRVMLNLSLNDKDTYVPLREITERESISKKYLENIMTVLSKAKLVDGAHGKGGGYRLVRSPAEYTVKEILQLTEGSLAPVACPECEKESCERADVCKTLPMWLKLDKLINDFFEGITLADLLEKEDDLYKM